MRRLPALAFGLVLGSLAADGAWANGRFPRAQRLLEQDGDASRLVLAATYGLLLTNDGGGEWRHLCELGFAFTIDELDPSTEILPDGAMLVQAPRSLNRAEPPFCEFAPVLGGSSSQTVVDFSLQRAEPGRVLALLRERGADGGTLNRLYESADAGKVFAELGVPLPSADVEFGLTLDVAPSDSDRLYVSATGVEAPGVLARSEDRGASWLSAALPLEPGEAPYLAAVHPSDADVLYVRSDSWVEAGTGVLAANDALFISDDGGETWNELHRAPAKLLGFALSPDGSEILLGYGDPVTPSRSVEASATGIYRASISDHAFAKVFEGPVSCLAWTANGIYACTSQAERGFALGLASDALIGLDDTEPFTPLLDLTEVVGPLSCPSESSAAVCEASWVDNCAVLGACDAASGAGGEAGSDGARSSGSCGCRLGAIADVQGVGWLVLGALLLVLRAPFARRARGRRSELCKDASS